MGADCDGDGRGSVLAVAAVAAPLAAYVFPRNMAGKREGLEPARTFGRACRYVQISG